MKSNPSPSKNSSQSRVKLGGGKKGCWTSEEKKVFEKIVSKLYRRKNKSAILEEIQRSIPGRSLKQIRSHFYKTRYKYDRAIGIYSEKKRKEETMKMIEYLNKDAQENGGFFQFQDEIGKKSIFVQMALLECVLDCQLVKHKEADVLTVNMNESVLNFALQMYFRRRQIKNMLEKERRDGNVNLNSSDLSHLENPFHSSERLENTNSNPDRDNHLFSLQNFSENNNHYQMTSNSNNQNLMIISIDNSSLENEDFDISKFYMNNIKSNNTNNNNFADDIFSNSPRNFEPKELNLDNAYFNLNDLNFNTQKIKSYFDEGQNETVNNLETFSKYS